MAFVKAAGTWKTLNISYFKRNTKTSAQHLSNPSQILFLKYNEILFDITTGVKTEQNKNLYTLWANGALIHFGYL